MELSQINSHHINSMSEINSAKTKNVENIDKSSNNTQAKIDKIELSESSSRAQSSFSSNTISNMNKISDLQQEQLTVTQQVNTLSKITQETTNVIESPKSGQVLDDIQPEIQSLITNFNTVSAEMKSTQSSSSASRTYFDGVVGAVPLSGEEIYQAVKQQQDRLEQVSQKINQEINNVVSNTKKDIDSQRKPESKDIDFEKESAQFNAQSLKEVKGPVIATQAHAQTEQNIKLLTS